MTKNSKYLLFLLFLFISCEKKINNDRESLILGDWIFEKESPKRKNYFYSDFGYSFEKNGSCETKPGYYHEKRKTEKEERKTVFLGTKTKYKIAGDSLYIFNLLSRKWDPSKIVFVDSKNLKISSDKNIILEFKKIEDKENEEANFDKIIISKSPCFGTCPINDIEINKNGDVYYYGEDYNLKNGYFKTKIKTSEFAKIQNDFKKTNFLELKDAYKANWTDDQEVSITFVNDHKIIKTISDYGRQSPKLFRITAYPITWMYQNLKLEQKETVQKFQNKYLYFSKGNRRINLTSSEIFYLSNLLSISKKTTKSFKPKYSILYSNQDTKLYEFETDGQFFKIPAKDGKLVIIDLGFNFIDKNELEKRISTDTNVY